MIRWKSSEKMKNGVLNWSFDPDDYARFTETVWPVVDSVPGNLRRLEAYFLYHAAKNLNTSTQLFSRTHSTAVVEIGSNRGRSAVAIGLGLKGNPNGQLHLYCVDPYLDGRLSAGLLEEFRSNTSRAGIADLITVIAKYSDEAARSWPAHEIIDLLWVDGNHQYEFVRDDFLLWRRYLSARGIVAFHDWQFVGVREALTEFLFASDAFQDVCAMNYNLVAARRLNYGKPTRRQLALKRRVYWALVLGTTNPVAQAIGMLHHRFVRPTFGNLRSFFRERLTLSADPAGEMKSSTQLSAKRSAEEAAAAAERKQKGAA